MDFCISQYKFSQIWISDFTNGNKFSQISVFFVVLVYNNKENNFVLFSLFQIFYLVS